MALTELKNSRDAGLIRESDIKLLAMLMAITMGGVGHCELLVMELSLSRFGGIFSLSIVKCFCLALRYVVIDIHINFGLAASSLSSSSSTLPKCIFIMKLKWTQLA